VDAGDYWQENRRFLTSVGAGALAFVLGLVSIRAAYGADLAAERASKARLESQLSESRFGAAEREIARSENEALGRAFERLSAAIEFEARAGFRLDPAGGSPVNQYHRTVARVRDRLLASAGRRNLYLDEGLGLPDLSPSAEDEIVRYLEALDAVERVVSAALDTGVDRVDDVRIRLDPGLVSRKGTGPIERTRVEVELAGTGLALARFLEATQRPRDGRPLTVEAFELSPARGRANESRLELTLSLLRLEGSDANAVEPDTVADPSRKDLR
jgi:hypothetical protein